jgi:hypothetical protein
MRELAEKWLYDNDLPADWENAVALELGAAIEDRQMEIITTHKEGRPPDMYVVDWRAQR